MIAWIVSLVGLTSIGGIFYYKQNKKIIKFENNEEHLLELAYFDPLTKLANRLKFSMDAPKLLEQANKNNLICGLIIIDIDDFKQINDNCGHAIGDRFLQQISEILHQSIDNKGAKESFVARLGGDEFVILLYNIKNANDVVEIVNDLYQQFAFSIKIDNCTIDPRLSSGISLFPYDGRTLSTLLKTADLALYAAKENGKNTFSFHEQKMTTLQERRFEYQSIIRYFIDTADFEVTYQPIVETVTKKIKGVEVLFGGNDIKHPDLNIQEMILVAEETNDIVELGEVIFKKACTDYVNNFTNKNITLSVNVSGKQLDDDNFTGRVISLINETKMITENLIIEITETAFIKNYKSVVAKLTQLSKLGISFSIDDFGRGYSSMSYLRNLTVSKLKIDKSFIDAIGDKKSEEIIKTIVLMTKTLGLISVAEGVETAVQFDFLKSISCDCIQGYFISIPLALDQLNSSTLYNVD